MNINLVYPSKYVKASDLGDKNVTVTIKSATMEDLGFGAEKERKLVIYFEKATKGLILNRTNAMIIASMYTPETDNWIGNAIILYAAKVKAFGAWHDAVRVKEQIPPRNVGAARMPEALTETPPLDDEDDLLDVDEGEPPTIHGDDAPAADLWEPAATDAPAPAAKKDKVVSQAQLARLHILGQQVYGAAWDEKRVKLVEAISKGAISSSKELTPDEATILIKGMESKLAAEVQATESPVANGAHA